METEFSNPLWQLVIPPAIALLIWPLARRSGRASADRIHELQDDLRHRRPRGYLVLALVALMVLAAWIDFQIRRG
jgi:hypothetical protein